MGPEARRGGLIDIEFLAQYLVLRHARSVLDLLGTSTHGVISTAAERNLLAEEDAECLLSAHCLYTSITQILRVTLDDGADPRQASDAVKRRLAKVADLPGMAVLENDLAERRQRVRCIFDRILGS